MFTKGYIDKRKKWPPLEFNLPEGKTSLLQKLCDQQHSPLPLGLSIYDPSDWDYVTFLPIDDFDYGTDILSLMTDKSLSYKRSEIDNSWKGRLSYTPPSPTSSTRVLEQLLKGGVDLRDICDRVSRGDIPYDWTVVVVHPKEREPKTPEARSFAIMTLEPRTFFCCLEDNLARKVFPFFPEQTMTMGASEKEEVFLDITKSHAGKCTLSIGMDFAKWCSHFREATVAPVSDRLNQLLGVENLYGFVHRFFKMSLIVLRHPSYCPTQETEGKKGLLDYEPGIYSGVESGLEGIQQKMWTLVTLCMLHWALWKFGFTYTITCQADNLVVHIFLYQEVSESPEQFSARVVYVNDKALTSISGAAKMIGHDVNPDECFSSTSFTTYGKDMWFNGKKLETVAKVVSRMFPKTTTDVPSTESIIANIAATGTSMVERTNNPVVSFLFTKFVEYLVISRELKRSLVHQYDLSQLPEANIFKMRETGFPLLCCLVPSNLGGLPVSSFAEYLYRGHSDPLSSSLGSLCVFRSLPIVEKYIRSLSLPDVVGFPEESESLAVGTKGYLLKRLKLIRDPYSIPLRDIRGASIQTQEHVANTLKDLAKKNRLLGPIVRLTTNRTDEENLMIELLRSRPLNPKVLHEVIKSSVYGVGAAISKRFTNTRTLRRISSQAGIDLVRAHIVNDFQYIKGTLHRMKLLLLRGSIPPSPPVYIQLTELRSRWGLGDLDGVTNYHPLVAGTWIPTHLVTPSRLTEIVLDPKNPLLVVSSLTSSSAKCKETRGGVTPYLGNLTSEKAVAKWTKPIDASPPLKDALRLIQIAKLCTLENSSFRGLIEQLAVTRTSLPLQLLYEMSKEQVGGTLGHRLNLSASLQGSRIASLPNWSTHFSVSANLSREMGSVDYPISYHEYYLTLLCVSRWFFGKVTLSPPFGLLFLIDLSPLSPIQGCIIDLPLEGSLHLRVPVVPRGSYYLHADSVTLSARSRAGMVMPVLSLRDKDATPTQALAQILLSLMTGNVRLVRKAGYQRSSLLSKTVIDLPEAELFTYREYISAGAAACIMYSARHIVSRLNKEGEIRPVVLQILLEAGFILAPMLFNTISLSANNDDELSKVSAGVLVSERSLVHLACSLAAESMRVLYQTTHLFSVPPVFEHTLSQMSSSLASRIYSLLCRTLVSCPQTVLSCKFLNRLLSKILERTEEESRIAGLISFVDTLGWKGSLSKDRTSAEGVIRTVRLRSPDPTGDWKTTSYQFPSLPEPREATATDCSISLTLGLEHWSPEDLIESWASRPFPGKSDSFLKWAPIFRHIKPGNHIYVIGIGAGGLLKCIPGMCKVSGLDLPGTVQPLGQSYVSYTSAYNHPGYSTRPLTWLRDVSDLSDNCVDIVLQDIRLSGADIVIIDVDKVCPERRLVLRKRIADEGVKCWARIASTKEDIRQVLLSVESLRGEGDDWWEPSISMGREVILGSSSRPLGLLKANGSITSPRVVAFAVEELTWDETLEFVLRFGGSVGDLADVENFILAKGRSRNSEGRTTPFTIYSSCISRPDQALKQYGRLLCRMCVVVVGRTL